MDKIYESTTYPGARNNDPDASMEFPTRDLSIINQPAGFIEFNNTEGFETLSFVHKTGAMVQMNNYYVGLLAPRDYKAHIFGNSFQQNNGNLTLQVDKSMDIVCLGDSYEKVGDIANWQKHEEQYLKDLRDLHKIKRLFEVKRVKFKNKLDQSEEQEKKGELAKCPSEEVSSTVLYTASPTIIVPAKINGCSDRTIFKIDKPASESYESKSGSGGKMFDGWWCLTCWGTDKSPSTQDGKWDPEKEKDKLTQKYIGLTEKLIKSEKHFGKSYSPSAGDKITTIGLNKVETIGTVFNTMEPFRVDPFGKLVPYGIKIDPFGGGVYTQYRESPLIEVVHVDSPLGGDYVQTISDRWNVNVGSNGIHFKTNGQFNIFGSIVNLLGESIAINSRTEVTIGAERFDVDAEIITLRPRSVERSIEDESGSPRSLKANKKSTTEPERHVLIDGNMNVAQNMIVGGGAHIEGELSIHHITAPMEYQITESDFEFTEPVEPCKVPEKQETKADLVGGKKIGYIGEDGYVYSLCVEDAVIVHPHYHYFKNIPLRLFGDSTKFEITVGGNTDKKELMPHDAVRAIGARNNFDNIILAQKTKNSETYDTVVEKFGGDKCGNPLVISNGDWEGGTYKPSFPSGKEGISDEKYRKTISKKDISDEDQKILPHYDRCKDDVDTAYTKSDKVRYTMED